MTQPLTAAPSPARKFGTFLGVFTPSVLTILGLIMYLRFGWVVGNAGLGGTVVIVLLASSITCITALSASALATNMKVGVGGEYYMVSHSLGLELGGAIGIPLYLCRTLSITFYCFGLAEALLVLWPADWGEVHPHAVQWVAAVTIVLITAVAGKSAAVALALQIPIMIAVALSILALAGGVLTGEIHPPALTGTFEFAGESGFWYVFAVFFPAVTGFTAGIGMSGDLKRPRHSIPRGTLAAVATGTTIYLLIPLLLSVTGKLSPNDLSAPGVGAWMLVALGGGLLIYPGIWGAILSSAFGSALGGPRVLQALANDGLAPRFLARASKTGQPTVATWISGAIALIAVALGGLNAVAQFVTILFLTLYVVMNLSAAIEKLAGDPSYRPTIRVPWWVSLSGSLGALAVMYLINPAACGAAIVLELALWFFLRRRAMQKRWGDVRAGMWVAVARHALLRLRRHPPDPRNWRPHILVFAGDAGKRTELIRLASWFNTGRGVVTACRLIEGDLLETPVDLDATRREMEEAISAAGLTAFPEVNVVPEFATGVVTVTQANGIAGLQSNTVMFGWPEKKDRLVTGLSIIRALSHSGKSSVLARVRWEAPPTGGRRIDLWWGGLENNGDLMLLLAHLLTMNTAWTDAVILVRSAVASEAERDEMETTLGQLISEARIQAEAEVVVRTPGESIATTIHRESREADLVFLGLSVPPPGSEETYAERLIELTRGLPTTIFVRNAGEFAGDLI